MSTAVGSFRDKVVENRARIGRDKLINSIAESDVCALASSYRNGVGCRFFRQQAHGSYNVCYFAKFDDGLRCVVRVPLQPCLAVDGSDKLRSEIATMQLISERTTIPTPKILAYELGSGHKLFPTFLILEYVEGPKLSSFKSLRSLSSAQRRQLHASLADIYTQLRRLEFPAIGRLTKDGDTYKVTEQPISIDTNMQGMEGLGYARIQDSYYADGPLNSANQFLAMQLDIAYNALLKSRGTILSMEIGTEALYHHHLFCRAAQEWVDPRLDAGPFVLTHDDLMPHNLIVNENMEITCVLDWEWSRVVPLQHFVPPFWLAMEDTAKLALPANYHAWLNSFKTLQAAVRAREIDAYHDDLLYREWSRASKAGGFLFANALNSWTEIEWVAYYYIGNTRYNGDRDLRDRINSFLAQDPIRRHWVSMKLLEQKEYERELAEIKGLPQSSSSSSSSAETSWTTKLGVNIAHIVQSRLTIAVSAMTFTAASMLLYRRIIGR